MTSLLERDWLLQVRAARLPAPVLEYRFHPTRRWRFDCAWPDQKLAVELEGGIWQQGRHTRGRGFEADCRKYNAAVGLGWRVLRLTRGLVHDGSGLAHVQELLRGTGT